ncbi:protein TMED8 [Pseudophryne corroboree]|uniref:protein TMED8 n=1 Tax=Pseudophryne corroboree TaxID=495146 RepID=UPI0030819F59
MDLAQDASSVSGELAGTPDSDCTEAPQERAPETPSSEEPTSDIPADEVMPAANEKLAEEEADVHSAQETKNAECPSTERSQSDMKVANADPPSECSSTQSKETSADSTQALVKELEALLALDPDNPPPHDVLMIQSEHAGTVDIVKADQSSSDSEGREGKAPPAPLSPAVTWTSANLREFKHRMASEKHGQLTVRRGEVMTVRVPTHPDGKRLCWEFATDDYDIGFGIYFDWTPVTSTAVTLHVSESSDEEEEEETESPWHSREGDVERGSVYRLRSRYGEIMQVFRRDSHREVQAGSHEYPGEGIYLLKLDNSYSLLRNKTLYFHVYYSS